MVKCKILPFSTASQMYYNAGDSIGLYYKTAVDGGLPSIESMVYKRTNEN